MEQIGRKVYYELSTGNVIVTTSEMFGDVIATTEAQDFAAYSALQPYQQSAVGVLQLTYGEDSANFQANYPFRVDITQNPPVLAWDTSGTLAQAQQQKLAQLQNSLQQQYAGGFSSSAVNSTAITWPFGAQAQNEWSYLLGLVAGGIFPTDGSIVVNDIDGNEYTLTQSSVALQLCTDARTFYTQWRNHYSALAKQVQAATTVADVNAIQW